MEICLHIIGYFTIEHELFICTTEGQSILNLSFLVGVGLSNWRRYHDVHLLFFFYEGLKVLGVVWHCEVSGNHVVLVYFLVMVLFWEELLIIEIYFWFLFWFWFLGCFSYVYLTHEMLVIITEIILIGIIWLTHNTFASRYQRSSKNTLDAL